MREDERGEKMQKYVKFGLVRYVVVIFRGKYSPKLTGIYSATSIKEAKMIIKNILSAGRGDNAFIVKAERWYKSNKSKENGKANR